MSSSKNQDQDSNSSSSKNKNYDDEQEDDVFELKNLITFFERHNIKTNALFVLDKSISAILIEYKQFPLQLLVYIPSKFEIRISGSEYLQIATYNIEQDDEDELFNPSLFQNQIQTEITKNQKLNRTKALQRFLPLISSSKIKLSYLDKNYLNIVKYNNDIVSYLCSNPNNFIGFYYTVDLESFYTLANSMEKEIEGVEKALNNAVFIKLEQLIEDNKKAFNKMYTDLQTNSPITQKKKFEHRMNLLNQVQNSKTISTTTKEKGVAISNIIRKDNFKQMFKLEFLANALNEFKNME